jgi:hypothetical protein
MKRPEPKPENLAKLTPEQRQVFDKWQEEGAKADAIMQNLLDAISVNDRETIDDLTQQLNDLIPFYCEHGRSVYSSCIACTEIEKTLFPDAYNANGDRIDDLYSLDKSKADLN